MSKFLKVCFCICIVGVLCAPSFGQDARMYWEPVGSTANLNDATQDTVVYASQGETVCVQVWLEGIGADFNSAAAQATAEDGASATYSGGIDADCSTVRVSTATDNCIGGPGLPDTNDAFYTLNTTATDNCGSLGTQDRLGWLRGYGDTTYYAILADSGCYMAQVCYDVSSDMCGAATIDWIGAPTPNTIITDAAQVAQLDAIFDTLTIVVGPLNDDCADAEVVTDGTYAYDATCAQPDGTYCDGTTGDIWFAYTATCTGDFSVSGYTGTATAHTSCAAQDGTCGTTDGVVTLGDDILIQLTGPSPVDGSITFACAPFCDPGDPDSWETDCGALQDADFCVGGLADGRPCPVGDECTGGTCVTLEAQCSVRDCDETLGCQQFAGLVGEDCDDGLYCTGDDEGGDLCGGDGLCDDTFARDCNDGAVCTLDTCDDDIDECVNTDINTIPCTIIDDCPPAAEECVDGFCTCVENPTFCLNVAAAPGPATGGPPCFEEDEMIVVTVDLGFATTPICAAQFYLEYDTSMLDFVSITPGGGVFNTVIFESVDELAGTIDYLVGENPGTLCLGQNIGLVATLEFMPIGECKTDGVCFRPHNPPTRLGGIDGTEVCPLGHVRPDGSCGLEDNPNADPCCTGTFTFDSTDPVVNCPDIVEFGNADCGTVTREVTWAPITATDNCDGDLPVTCTITHNGGVDVSDLLDAGGIFPPGVTTIDCTTVVDMCDNSADCWFMVVNSGQNGLHVDVELSATMAGGPLTRGIEFEVSDCGAANPTTVVGCETVDFGFPWHVPGHGEFQAKLPPGNYVCLEAWDPLHTLKSTCDVTCEDIEGKGSVWFASFKGTKDLSDTCHWLVNGNLNGLDLDGIGRIDILDYVTYLAAVINNAIPGANTTCLTAGPHGDINGDGIVNLMDFSFILVNIFNTDKAGCDAVCFPSPDLTVAPPRESVSVRELTDMGFGREARAADINGDGTVDLSDMALYLNGGEASRSVRGSR